MIEITNTKINRVKEGKLLAYAMVTINNCIVLSGIKLYEGKNGRYIVFPSRKSKNKRIFSIAFPCNNETREQIFREIELEYLNSIFQ